MRSRGAGQVHRRSHGTGEWTFEAPTREWMILTRGSWDAKLPGSEEWKTFSEGDSFQIGGNESFTVRITDTVAYLCPYTFSRPVRSRPAGSRRRRADRQRCSAGLARRAGCGDGTRRDVGSRSDRRRPHDHEPDWPSRIVRAGLALGVGVMPGT
ncbi:pyrimidine/purine nucleoside phosphorylase [Saccharopolyspora sp. NPDC003752]